MPSPYLLQVAGYGSFLVAIRHAGVNSSALSNFKLYRILLSLAARLDGIKGLIWTSTGLLNVQWSQTPKSLEEPLSRIIAALIVAIAWASSAWYFRRSLMGRGIMTAIAGALQAWAAL
ncbi:hypothetical protein N7523_010664 [Penicillium sp. IBT 18751x]|nr:hypothetical protein N7523_010664 [Penicillium sp. IBT 18751x]